MSFGSLSNIIKDTLKAINKRVDDKPLLLRDYHRLHGLVHYELKDKYPDLSHELVVDIFTRYFQPQFTKLDKINFDGGKNCFRQLEEKYPDIEVPEKYIAVQKQFEKLANIPQPEQRTKEWFDYRFQRITASDTGEAIDQSPYQPVEYFILKKCDPDHKFLDNENVYHGKKYETIATKIYEHIYNTRVYEFGALPSEKYPFLGASPDGICSKFSLDNKFSDRIGTMLEIKCPVRREIQTKGKIAGEICPYYYFCQVQQQLECCELEVCDFWQCKILEFKDRHEYLNDACSNTKHTFGTDGKEMTIDSKLKKGIVLKFLPKVWKPEFDGDNIDWKSKFVYPERLDMDEAQYDEWILKNVSDWQTKYPDIAKDYYYDKVIYWKLYSSHNVPIPRDRKFMANIIPILQDTWSKVCFYRKNPDLLQEVKDICQKRSKYIKFNTGYKLSNNIVESKILFLNDSLPEPVKKKKTIKAEPTGEPEFIDSEEKPKTKKKKVKEIEEVKPKKKVAKGKNKGESDVEIEVNDDNIKIKKFSTSKTKTKYLEVKESKKEKEPVNQAQVDDCGFLDD